MKDYTSYVSCPNCGCLHTEIDEFSPHFDGKYAIVPFYCHDCGTTWDAIYKFERNEEVDVLRREE